MQKHIQSPDIFTNRFCARNTTTTLSLKNKKGKDEKQFGKFIEILNKLYINIPLIHDIQQMSNYSKFMKDILTKRKHVEEFAIVALTQEQTQLVQGNLPPKLKDLKSFTIHCNIRYTFCGRSLCDFRSNINLSHLYLSNRL